MELTPSQTKQVLGKIFDEADQLEAAAELKEKWSGNLDKVVRPTSGFAAIPVPPRELIMGKWFKQGDLGFIYGPRGFGKTWLAMFLARRCAEGPGSMGTTQAINIGMAYQAALGVNLLAAAVRTFLFPSQFI